MAVVVMGVIGAAAAVLVVVEALMKFLPLLIVALAGYAVLRLVGRRHPSRGPVQPVPARAAARQLAGAQMSGARRVAADTGRWVLVPVWFGPADAPTGHPVIDGEVLGEDGVRRV